MSDTTILAWYFSDESRTLRHGDGRKIELGSCHEVEGNPVLYEHGLHASVKLLDALQYAPGSIVYRVELSGEMVVSNDKIVAQKRTYLAGGIDVSDVLMVFARKQALSVAHLWDIPPVVRGFLETGNESLKIEARAAAEAVAWDTASAAESAAGWAAASAVWAAEKDSWVAGRVAVWAARSVPVWAAGSAVWAAGRAVWVAGRDARWAAEKDSWATAWADAEKMLVNMIDEAIKEATVS
jgi:hypothetical protein